MTGSVLTEGGIETAPPRRRILLAIAGLPAGGAERQMALLAQGMDRTRFEPGLLIFNRAEKIHYRDVLDTDIWFRALGLSGGSRLQLVPRIIRGIHQAVHDFQPDIVHSSLNVANHMVRAAALLSRRKTKIVTSVRNDFSIGYRPSEKLIERLLCRRSDAITCNNDKILDQLVTGLSLPSKRISMIPNGIDNRFFDAGTGTLPEWWPSGPVALSIGRFTRQKNHLALIKAFAAAAGQDAIPGWSLVIVGEGPLHTDMKSAIDAAGLADRVLIRPPEPDVAPFYRASALVIAPSLFEGMSNVCIEAAASGIPVVASPAAAPGALIAEGGGWLIGDDPEDMTTGLIRILQLPATDLQAAGARAKQYALENHSVSRMIRETMTLYDKLVMTA